METVKQAEYFSVLADEVTDVSNCDQMPLVLRYVNHNSHEIKEDFVDFILCDTGVTGLNLSQKILGFQTMSWMPRICGATATTAQATWPAEPAE